MSLIKQTPSDIPSFNISDVALSPPSDMIFFLFSIIDKKTKIQLNLDPDG
jgi:hypothetical protein